MRLTADQLTPYPGFILQILGLLTPLTPPPGHPHAANRIPQDIVTVNNESEINNFVSMFNNGGFNDDSDDDDL